MNNKRKAGDGEGAAKLSKFQCLAPSSSSANRGRNCKVKVYVRVRPLKSNESKDSEVVQVLDEDPSTSLIFDPKVSQEQFYFKGEVQKMRDINKKMKKNQLFEFDKVFPYGCSNSFVFESTAKSIVPAILDGFNCSVFAYGATGAGKTYTMLGKEDSPGISYLTIKQLLDHIDASKHLNTSISVSYLEVYNEEVRDLLSPGGRKLELREEAGGSGTVISGLRLIPITNTSQLYSLLDSGNKIRTQHPTDSNAESSRSHAVFQVLVRMQEKSVGGQVKMAKLTMIDLAGSERGCATGFRGKQFKEGRAINQSLLALGNCINALADGQKYVPYRDSKLTRILKDSLGGNCQTIMIANISPSSHAYDETYNTLKYATRARSIITTSNQNLVNSNLNLGQYKQLATSLRVKISKAEEEWKDLCQWEADMQKVFGDRIRILSELMSFDSQIKITEWRLNNAMLAQTYALPERSTRLVTSMEQWKSRIDVLKRRSDEYFDIVQQNNAESAILNDRMMVACKHVSEHPKHMYQVIYASWNDKMERSLKEVENQHCQTMMKLLMKNDESHSSLKNDTMPLLVEHFNLLKAHKLVTEDMRTKYEKSMRMLQGVKTVSWEELDEASGDDLNKEDATVNQPSLTRLRMLGGGGLLPLPQESVTLSTRSVQWPAGGTITPGALHHKKQSEKRSALRTLQQTSKPNLKGSKHSPAPKKMMQQHISSLNKENIVKELPKKKYYSEVKRSLMKRTPFKSPSLNKLSAI